MVDGLVSDPITRAATFFALAFVLTTAGGIVIGEFRTGLQWGLGLGVAFAIFAYLFVRPVDDEGGADEDVDESDEGGADAGGAAKDGSVGGSDNGPLSEVE